MSYIINSKRFGGIADNLDAYPPQACYGLKYLLSSYTGDVISAQRSDFGAAARGFTPDEITDGTLATYAGGASVWVLIWYDQSGNGYDTASASASGNRPPYIVNSGVINLDGVNAYLNRVADESFANIVSLPDPTGLGSVFCKYRSSDPTTGTITGNDGGGSLNLGIQILGDFTDGSQGSGTPKYYKNGVEITDTSRDNLHQEFVDGVANLITINNVTFDLWSGYRLGFGDFFASTAAADYPYFVYYWGGNDQSANRTEIEAILNNIF